MSNMYLVVKTAPGEFMTRLMAFLSENNTEFSVTNNLANLVDPAANAQSTISTVPENTGQPQDLSSQWEPLQTFPEDPIKEEPGIGSSMEDVVVKEEQIEELEDYRDVESPPVSNKPGPSTSRASNNVMMPSSRKRRNSGEIDEGTSITSASRRKVTRKSAPVDTSPMSTLQLIQQQSQRTSETRQFRKLKCHHCHCIVDQAPSRRIAHITAHLQLKVWCCVVCNGMFSRADKARKHFNDVHSTSKVVPFIEKITPDQRKQLMTMMDHCFPELAKDEMAS